MILVLGGTGFVGSHLIVELILSGKKIRALQRRKSSIETTKKIFSYYSSNYETLFNKIEWVEGNILDYLSLIEAMEGVSEVYHSAANVSFSSSQKKDLLLTNIKGTTNVVNACLETKIKKMAFISSIATLGTSSRSNYIDENSKWLITDKHSYYAISKYESEMEVWRGISEGLNAVIINPAVIIGAGNWDKGSAKIFSAIYKGVRFYTKGSTAYINIKDVTKTCIQLMEKNIFNQKFILAAENLDYKNFMYKIANNIKAPKPKYMATTFILSLAWRWAYLTSLFTLKKPTITKEIIKTIQEKKLYSAEKIKKTLNISFTSIDDTIKEVSKFFLKEYT